MNKKKKIRHNFRKGAFIRDKFTCVICGKQDPILRRDPEKLDYQSKILDCHHVTPREQMPNGGYVKENGITLCKEKCHLLAEEYLQGTNLDELFSPKNLYSLINSTIEKATYKAKQL